MDASFGNHLFRLPVRVFSASRALVFFPFSYVKHLAAFSTRPQYRFFFLAHFPTSSFLRFSSSFRSRVATAEHLGEQNRRFWYME
jgi:hypothetical protein